MKVNGFTANLPVRDAADREFFTDYLGLSEVQFDLGWVVNLASPETGACVQLVTRDETSQVDSVVSVGVSDVEEAYAEAQRCGYEIVHPLTVEPWGVRRFFVRAPGGAVLNMVEHA